MKSHSHTGAPDKYIGTLDILVIIFWFVSLSQGLMLNKNAETV